MRTPVQGLAHARGCLKTGACAVPCLDERMRSAVGGGWRMRVAISKLAHAALCRDWRMRNTVSSIAHAQCGSKRGTCLVIFPGSRVRIAVSRMAPA